MILLCVNLILGVFWFWIILKTISHVLETEPGKLGNKVLLAVFFRWIMTMIPTVLVTSGLAIILKHF